MTLSVRLTFAGASSARASDTSTAAGLLGAFRRCCRRRFLENSGLQLVFDFREILGFGFEIARMRPLEARLENPADPEIGISQMVIDRRILRLEFNSALEILHCLLVVADPVVGPAEGVDDIAVVRALLDR